MNPERVGRDGFLRLRFARSGAKTILAQSRFSLPLQVLTPIALEDGPSYLMLLNPTGGVLGGDRLVTEIEQEPGTHACLSTPSATRVYRTAGDPAVLETAIRLGEGATLEYFPDHVIPHRGSALRQSLHVEMAAGGRVILIDAMASGRRAHGERWRFREIDSLIDIRVRGQAAYINRARIIPASGAPDRFGVMDDFDYMVSMIVVAESFSGWAQVCEALNAEFASMPEVHGAATLLARHGCVARLLARSAPDMTVATKRLWDAARRHVLGLTPFHQRKY